MGVLDWYGGVSDLTTNMLDAVSGCQVQWDNPQCAYSLCTTTLQNDVGDFGQMGGEALVWSGLCTTGRKQLIFIDNGDV